MDARTLAKVSVAPQSGLGASTLIDGRYRVEAELGHGGMGSVYRVFDEGKACVRALKLTKSEDPRQQALFEREYQTLSELRHPRVIKVYDFGISEAHGRYFTMELLGGRDLFASAPLPWSMACEHLRDVCTSLSLLHARRLVHRDVNPRNVRLDQAGRAKLLDFGAVTHFGIPTDMVGTPSCLSPEVLHGKPVDGRADLFSLGVVAFWALTGKLPYPARQLADVEAAWRVPPVPVSELVPGVPPALDELILALLSIDPLGRPSSAAEVIDRLNAITLLDDEPLAMVAESHLASSPLVGRSAEQTKLEQLLSRVASGRGGVLSIKGEAGFGKTRLLSELRIGAQLSGLCCVHLAGGEHTERDAVGLGLLRALFEVAPSEARAASALHSPLLAPLLARLGLGEAGAAADASAAKLDENELTVRTHAALAALLLEVSRKRPLLVSIDDAHLLHHESASALLPLALAAHERRLLLAVAHPAGQGPPAVQQLKWMGTDLELAGLDLPAIEELVHGIFGDVPHRTRLAQWLSATSRGRPGQLHALLHDLVSRQVVRYAGSAWLLPAQIAEAVLPEDSRELARARLSRLSTTARALSLTLAVHHGALPESLLLRVMSDHEPSDILSALAQLSAEQLTQSSEAGHQVRHESVRTLLLEPLSEQQRARVHAGLAAALRARAAEPIAAMLRAELSDLQLREIVQGVSVGYHLLEAGDETTGVALLRNGAIELTVRGEGLTAAAADLEAAVETLRRRGRSRRVYGSLMTALTLAGTYADWRLSYRYGDEMLDILAEGAGLKLAKRLAPYLGGTLALYVSLCVGFLLFLLVPRRRMANKFRELLLGLMGIGSAVLGVCTVLQDRKRAEAVAQQLAPLRYFPRTHPVRKVHEFQLGLCDHARGLYAESYERCRQALSYVRSDKAKRQLPERARLQLEGGIVIVFSQLDALRTDGRAEETLQAIERLGSPTSAQMLASSRVAYHGHRGERAELVRALEQMDRLAAESGSIWRNDVSVPRMLWSTNAMCEDVMSLKRGLQQVQTLATDLPSVARLRDITGACYLSERGMSKDALLRYETVLREAQHERGLRAVQQLSAYARILRKAGLPARAREVCELARARLGAADAPFTVITFGVYSELALALAALGELASAIQVSEQLLAEHAQHDNPLLRGLAHGVRAQIALLARDAPVFEQQMRQMRSWFLRAQHPALIAQWQRLAQRAQAARQLALAPAANDQTLPGAANAAASFETEIEHS